MIEYLLWMQSSSNLYAKNSSSKFFRNCGFTRNEPTTPNNCTNPIGVHTARINYDFIIILTKYG